MALCDPLAIPYGPIKDLKLIEEVGGNLFQHYKLVSRPNEGIKDHLGRPNGQKMRFWVKLGTKMAPVTPRWAI